MSAPKLPSTSLCRCCVNLPPASRLAVRSWLGLLGSHTHLPAFLDLSPLINPLARPRCARRSADDTARTRPGQLPVPTLLVPSKGVPSPQRPLSVPLGTAAKVEVPDLVAFLVSPVPRQAGPVQCRIERDKGALGGKFPRCLLPAWGRGGAGGGGHMSSLTHARGVHP